MSIQPTGEPRESRGHGGKRIGSGRKKKKPTSSLPLPNARTQQRTNLTTTQPSAFFAPRISQGISRPDSSNNNGTHGDSASSTRAETHSGESRPEGHFINSADFQRLANEVDEIINNDEHADIWNDKERLIDESISDCCDDSIEVNAETAEAETKNSEVVEHSINHQYSVLSICLITEIAFESR
ncbi:hypothetical protein EV361DRAFT_937960 [Lentinula raphanica]|nr:hypothetical protein EV361DRAFT_937960 [Lentinula raphanica]